MLPVKRVKRIFVSMFDEVCHILIDFWGGGFKTI